MILENIFNLKNIRRSINFEKRFLKLEKSVLTFKNYL